MLTEIKIERRLPLADGKRWGSAGPYEAWIGHAHFELNPLHPASQVVRDIQFATRTANGKVAFHADLIIFRPAEPQRSSGLILFEAVNRGVRLTPWMFQRAPFSLDPISEKDLGDGLLLHAGHTLVWLGWQWDVPATGPAGRLRAELPRAQGITGRVRSEFVCDTPARSFSLGDSGHTPYPVGDPADPGIQLTVRDSAYGNRSTVSRQKWDFSADCTKVETTDDLVPGRIYEIVYPAKDPVVAGLGLAGIRDLVSFLKHGGAANVPPEIFEIHHQTRAAAFFGASQSGRLVRHFLFDGFNQDERGAQVFDGAWAHLAGAGRGSFNHRFAQASRGADPQVNHDYPTFLPPFTDRELLDACRKQHSIPKLFCTNTSYEYWAFGASLIHASLDGTRDIAPEKTTRIYHFAGSQHVPGPWPPGNRGTRWEQNPNDFSWILRNLMDRWCDWILNGAPPPQSVYPTLHRKTLISAKNLNFPARSTGKHAPEPYLARRLDFGQDFAKSGIIANEPPKSGQTFHSLVPKVDADGNEVDGVRTADIAVPLGAYTGWNYRSTERGAPDVLADNVGAYFRFTREELARRYPNRRAFHARIVDHVELLVRQGLLRSQDAEAATAQCMYRWSSAISE